MTIPTDSVRWFLDDVELRPDQNVEIIKDGATHKLVMKNITIEDEGEIMVRVGDKSSTASLFVEGNYIYMCIVIFQRGGHKKRV